MNVSILTLIVVLFLILVIQVLTFVILHKVNKQYNGIGFWLIGSSLIMLGFILLPTASLEPFKNLSKIANPIIIVGHILLYVGIKKFVNKTINKWIPILLFFTFTLFYYSNIFLINDIVDHTYITSFTLTIISFFMAYELFLKKEKFSSSISNFLAVIFSFYGIIHFINILNFKRLFSGYPISNESIDPIINSFISIIFSNLWTFGFILLIVQKFYFENKEEKQKFQTIFNTNIDAQSITRLDNGIALDVNDQFTIMSGYSKAESIGNPKEHTSFWANKADRELFTEELKNKGFFENKEYVFQRKDKSSFVGMITANVISIESVSYVISVIRDITERKEFENALIESEEKYRSILHASPDAIAITDLEGNILMISPVVKEIFKYDIDIDDFIGMHIFDFILPEEIERAQSKILEMHEGSTQNTNEYTGVHQNRTVFDIEVNSGIIQNAYGVTNQMVFIIRDITERKKIENALIESEEKYRSILYASPDVIAITDLEGNILMISPVVKEIFKYDIDIDDFIGMHIFDFILPEEIERAQSKILEMHEGSTQNTNEYTGVHQDRTVFDIEVNSGIIQNAYGKTSQMVFIIRDITERKLIESQMEKLFQELKKEKDIAQHNAITDSLSGLYNRGYFDKILRLQFSELEKTNSVLSLIMLDIDNFKKYNDTYGHPAGDNCIQKISAILMEIVEGTPDVAARYGGEEFILVLPGSDKKRAVVIGERIRKSIEELSIPHKSSQTYKYVTVSVGIITVNPVELTSPDRALKLVDDSLYAAKDNGRNCCFYGSQKID